MLGTIHARLGQYPEAVQSFKRASELAPEDDSYHLRLLRAHLDVGRREEALAEFKYLEDRKSPLAAQVLSEIYPS